LLRLTASDVKDGWISLDRTSKTRTLQMVPVHPRVAEIAARLPLGVTKSQCFASWSAAQKATGIKARWHDLRHTCASWLVESGSDMLTVRDMLGHSTITMAQRYAHRAPKHLKDAISKVA
jgi:integrase